MRNDSAAFGRTLTQSENVAGGHEPKAVHAAASKETTKARSRPFQRGGQPGHSQKNGKWPTNEGDHTKPNKLSPAHGVGGAILTYHESTVQHLGGHRLTFFFELEDIAVNIKPVDSASACWSWQSPFLSTTTQ